MSEDFFPVPQVWAQGALMDRAAREADYARSIADSHEYWMERAQRLDWITPPTRTNDSSFAESDFGISWFADGVLNVSVNCIDRHLAERGEQTAIIWEPDSPDASPRRYSYNDLHAQVCRFANVLKGAGVTKGDRVTIYLPMIPEAAFALLACARIGAIHSVVFGGFSPEALCGRIQDCDSRFVITADEGCRAGKTVPLKANVDAALKDCPSVKRVIVVQATGGDVTMAPGRDLWLHEEAAKVAADCPPEPMRAEDPLFILYTSGSTGKPKGVLHTSGGYLLWAGLTHELCFDYRPGDIYWCAADIGWVTGHSYIVYGPLANGATTLMYEGVPNHPTPARIWQVVDRHQVQTLFTAPTALRALMKEGDAWPQQHDRSSLRLLGTVGEPIKEPEWMWYHKTIGEGRCPIVDTWWQTETGGHMISPLPGVTTTKPGSACHAVPGVFAELVDDDGNVVERGGGYLTITRPWPSMLRGIWGDPERYHDTYWSKFEGRYFAGDGAKIDDDGYLWLLGRVDDVMNVSGPRISTAEVESALVDHPAVAEAAVVGATDDTTGQAIVGYVILRGTHEPSAELGEEIRLHVATKLGPIARPRAVFLVPDLPKTRSGKIMRRLLRDVAEGRDLGDTTTLADSGVVDEIRSRAAESQDED